MSLSLCAPAENHQWEQHLQEHWHLHTFSRVSEIPSGQGALGKAPVSQFSSIQSLSHVQLFVTPWTAAHQASLSITNSWSLLKVMSMESVMPSIWFPGKAAVAVQSLKMHEGTVTPWWCCREEWKAREGAHIPGLR